MAAQVRKRDGETLQAFTLEKIQRAIDKAWHQTFGANAESSLLLRISVWVASNLPEGVVDVETIQDTVEVALMKHGYHNVAKNYIIYRQRRTEARMARKPTDPNAVADYIHPSKYARYRPELWRREVYSETIERVADMHLRRFAPLFTDDPTLRDDIEWAFRMVQDKRVLPSMRSMQFAGEAIERINNRMYNCTFTFIDRPRVFAEALYLLLCGSGVGFSVQYEHVDKLPVLAPRIDTDKVVHHTIGDDIEGWAEALNALVMSFIDGVHVEFNYSEIRAKGKPLKTSGGKAPGHMKLKEALENVRRVLTNALGRKLRPIECYDVLCHVADAVLAGGIRRSSMIALFSLEDSEMVYAKTGDWWRTTPWRANSNNSVMLKRDEVKKAQFKRIFKMTKEWGEPGFYFTTSFEYGANPCVEIGLNPVLEVTPELFDLFHKRKREGKYVPDTVRMGERFTGWAFCNLCEINAAKLHSYQDFVETAYAATLIGTLQAAYTSMPYLGWVSETIAEREALLGIGMTGILDAPDIATKPEFQERVAKMVVEWNKDFAARIGIRPAARTTCVKPAGTTSLELGCVANGHHPHHARRYIRRVTANPLEPVFQYFKSINPHMVVQKPNGDWVIEFPVEAPAGAIVKSDVNALQFLEMVRSTQKHWVIPGTARPDSSPGLTHNVSNTVHVRESEWEDVAEFLWENRDYFSGVSFIPEDGDKKYAFAPYEAITTEADEARWNQLIASYVPVDYTQMMESEDGTDLTGEAACAGGACEIK